MAESLMDKIDDKFHDSSSESDSDDDRKPAEHLAATAKAKAHNYKSKVYRLFGRDQPVHKVLGAGKGNPNASPFSISQRIISFPFFFFFEEELRLRSEFRALFN